MTPLVTLVQIEVVAGIIFALIILYFQVRAYRKYRQRFFATLATSSVLGILAVVTGSAPYFVPFGSEAALTLYWISVPVAVLASALATWGSVKLYLALDEWREPGTGV